jgi:hypothetical protein
MSANPLEKVDVQVASCLGRRLKVEAWNSYMLAMFKVIFSILARNS